MTVVSIRLDGVNAESIEPMESSYELIKSGIAVALLCAYGVFMFLHVVAILFG